MMYGQRKLLYSRDAMTTEVWSLHCSLIFTRASDGGVVLSCRLLAGRGPPDRCTNPGDKQGLEIWQSGTLEDNTRTGTRITMVSSNNMRNRTEYGDTQAPAARAHDRL